MKSLQYRLGYLSGAIAKWRKRCSIQYVLGYLSGVFGK